MAPVSVPQSHPCYMNWQAPGLTVEFLQKAYAENVLEGSALSS